MRRPTAEHTRARLPCNTHHSSEMVNYALSQPSFTIGKAAEGITAETSPQDPWYHGQASMAAGTADHPGRV